MMASVLQGTPSHLRDLDMSWNHLLKDEGVELLCDGLRDPQCKLEILRSAMWHVINLHEATTDQNVSCRFFQFKPEVASTSNEMVLIIHFIHFMSKTLCLQDIEGPISWNGIHHSAFLIQLSVISLLNTGVSVRPNS